MIRWKKKKAMNSENLVCLTCGVKQKSDAVTCINGHSDWLSERDLVVETDQFKRAQKIFGLCGAEVREKARDMAVSSFALPTMARNTVTTAEALRVGDRFYKANDKKKEVLEILPKQVGYSGVCAKKSGATHPELISRNQQVIFLRHSI